MFDWSRCAIARASTARHWGLILGTLGRQGSHHILSHIESMFQQSHKTYTIVLLSEIFPYKLAQFPECEA